MAKSHIGICANCDCWDCFEVGREFSEDECGGCRVKDGEVTYGDQEKCDDFKLMKRPRVYTDRR